MQRVLAGDTEAYAVLVGRYRDRFARYALHILGTRYMEIGRASCRERV